MTGTVLTETTAATMAGPNYGLIDDAAIAVSNGAVVWVGPQDVIPDEFAGWSQQPLDGRLTTPALIDCHTHLVHGGNRAREFEMRLQGASYEEVARAGGGIVSTVEATRAATAEDLMQSALPRARALLAEGVTTIEIKSGYGLDLDTELRMLRTARQIQHQLPIRVRTSFLGAHAVPKGMDPDTYIDDVAIPALHAAHDEGLADAVDGFCEGIAFTPEQIERVFKVAQSLGLPVKLHAEQLSHLGGTALATRYGALSADHLEYATAEDAALMAHSGTVAVILPGAFYTLHETQAPPVAAFREQRVPMALATDCNPGSSPATSLLLMLNMGCTLFALTPEEALAGVTRNPALALGLDDCGIIAPGLRADLAVWDVEHPAELAYRIGFNPLHQRIFADNP